MVQENFALPYIQIELVVSLSAYTNGYVMTYN